MNRYHYTQSGLDNVWLQNGFNPTDTPYGKGVSIENVHGLHEAIGKALIDKPGRLTGKELRFLRKELELSQARLGELIGKSGQTVAHWEKKPEVQEDIDFVVRHIYKQNVVDPRDSYVVMVDKLKAKDLDLYNGEFAFQETKEGWRKAG